MDLRGCTNMVAQLWALWWACWFGPAASWFAGCIRRCWGSLAASAAATVAIGSAEAVHAASNRHSAAATVAAAFVATLPTIGAFFLFTSWCQLVVSGSPAGCAAAANFLYLGIRSWLAIMAIIVTLCTMGNHAMVPAWLSYVTAVQAGIAKQQAAPPAAAGPAAASVRAAGSCCDGRKVSLICSARCCLSCMTQWADSTTCCSSPGSAFCRLAGQSPAGKRLELLQHSATGAPSDSYVSCACETRQGRFRQTVVLS